MLKFVNKNTDIKLEPKPESKPEPRRELKKSLTVSYKTNLASRVRLLEAAETRLTESLEVIESKYKEVKDNVEDLELRFMV